MQRQTRDRVAHTQASIDNARLHALEKAKTLRSIAEIYALKHQWVDAWKHFTQALDEHENHAPGTQVCVCA